MKQYLTEDQILSLSELQRRKLREWWKPAAGDVAIWGEDTRPLVLVNDLIENREWEAIGTAFYIHGQDQYNRDRFLPLDNCLPLLSIGQCIQFLMENEEKGDCDWIDDNGYEHIISRDDRESPYRDRKLGFDLGWSGELIDALWESIKLFL